MTTTKRINWLKWLGITVFTLLLATIAYSLFKPAATEESMPPSSINSSSSVASDKTLSQAIQALAETYRVSLTLDNSFLDDCPYPASLSGEQSFKKALSQLARYYEIEIHEAAPNEYLLIGGKCP